MASKKPAHPSSAVRPAPASPTPARGGSVRAGSARGAARALLRWASRLALALALVWAMLVALWAFVPPVSTLMAARYLTLRPVDRRWVPLDRMSPKLVAAVLASEDSQFCRHDGVDFTQLKLVIDSAGKAGPARGASTIDMQVAKNLFLAPVHSYLRKGVEILFALAIDRLWGKRRVLEVYLNVAEWGDGVFGAEAAARRHFGRASADLTARQASLLALALPNPYERDPARPRGLYTRLVGLNQRRARDMGPWLDCLPAPKR